MAWDSYGLQAAVIRHEARLSEVVWAWEQVKASRSFRN